MRKESTGSLPLLSTLQFPGMLYASTIRSSAARAKSVHLSHDPLPAGYLCITPADIAAEGCSLLLSDGISLFAHADVSYKGEPIGLIVGPDAAICDELAQSATAEYEEEDPSLEWESFSSSQIAYRYGIDYGEVDLAFSKSAKIEKAIYRNGIFDHHYSEPMGAIANWEYDKIAIYCATQWPTSVRQSVAAAMKIAESDVVVKPTNLGNRWTAASGSLRSSPARRPWRRKFAESGKNSVYPRGGLPLYAQQARSAVTIRSASDNKKAAGPRCQAHHHIGAYNRWPRISCAGGRRH